MDSKSVINHQFVKVYDDGKVSMSLKQYDDMRLSIENYEKILSAQKTKSIVVKKNHFGFPVMEILSFDDSEKIIYDAINKLEQELSIIREKYHFEKQKKWYHKLLNTKPCQK